MSLTASASSHGDTLRHDVLIDGRHRLVTDEPERLGGSDTGPAPHELLPAALATCIATTIRTYARTKHWELSGVRVDVVYENKATPRHFDVDIRLPAALSAEQTKRLLRVAEACPVRRAIEAGMEFDEHLGREHTGRARQTRCLARSPGSRPRDVDRAVNATAPASRRVATHPSNN